MMSEEPLIWTSKGNLPLSSLEYETRWEQSETYIKFIETHRLDDEVVREAAHVLMLQPLTSMAETEEFSHG